MARHRSLRLLLAVLPIVAACGGSSTDDPGPLSVTHSSVTITPATVTADGVAAATVTVRARDAQGRPLAGRAVTFTASGQDNVLGRATAKTDDSGDASTTLASTRAETKQITVAVSGVALPDQPVAFVAGPAAALAFTANPTSLTAGGTLSAVRVAVVDAHGNTVLTSTAAIDLALSGGTAGATLAGTTSVSAATGESAFGDLSMTRAGQGYTLLASSSGLTGASSAPFDVAPAAPSLTASTVQAVPAQEVADGTAIAVRVALQDAYGNAVPGVAVTLDATGSDNTVGQPSVATDAEGVATGTLSSIRAEGKTVSAWADGLPLVPTATATFVPGPASSLVVLDAPSSGVAGEALASLRIGVVDAHGNAAAAPGTVALALAGGPAATLYGTLTQDAVASIATFADLSLRVAGAGYVLRATSGTLQVDAAGFTVAPSAAATSSVASSKSPVADGADTTTLTATVLDTYGNRVPGVTVTLVATGSANTLAQPLGPTDPQGVCSGTLTSTRAEAKSVTATASGVTAAPTPVTFVAGPAAALVVLAGPSSGIAGETLTPAVRVRIEDAHGNAAAPPGAVTLALAGGPAATLLGTLTQDAAASVATFGDLSLQTAGTGYVLRATSGTLQVDSSAFAVGPAAAASSTVASSRSPVADGTETTTLTATVRDAYGNVVPGVSVTLAATGTANTLVQPLGPTDPQGACTGTLASTRAEAKSVTAAAAGVTPTPTSVTFVAGPPDAAQSDFTATPATVPADGTTPVALAVVVRDAHGNPVKDVAVAFASSRGGDTVTSPAATGADGVTSGTVRSGTAGSSVLSGTFGGTPFAVTRTVRFEGSFSTTSPAKALSVSGKACATSSYANSGRRLALDAVGTVYLASICSGEGYVATSTDGAKTFGTPVSTGLTALQQITVRGGPEGVAYVAGTTGAGATTFTVTTDQGATFATPTVLASGGATTYLAPGLAARGDDVFVQSQNSFATVYRNASRGSGSFSATALPTNTSGVFWGLMVDSAGNVWSGLDNSSLNLSKSTDGGVTFSSWTPVAGAGVMYSSWDLGGDVIWVAGYPGNGPYKISVSAPTVGTAVGGALIVNPNETTVAVDAAGTGYVAFGDATNGVRLQRATLADTSFGSATTIDAAGRNPALAAPAGTDKVVVAYDKAGEIWTTVKTF